MKRNAPPYTIKMLKESISLDGQDGETLLILVDSWYIDALSKGYTMEDAVDYSREKVSDYSREKVSDYFIENIKNRIQEPTQKAIIPIMPKIRQKAVKAKQTTTNNTENTLQVRKNTAKYKQ